MSSEIRSNMAASSTTIKLNKKAILIYSIISFSLIFCFFYYVFIWPMSLLMILVSLIYSFIGFIIFLKRTSRTTGLGALIAMIPIVFNIFTFISGSNSNAVQYRIILEYKIMKDDMLKDIQSMPANKDFMEWKFRDRSPGPLIVYSKKPLPVGVLTKFPDFDYENCTGVLEPIEGDFYVFFNGGCY